MITTDTTLKGKAMPQGGGYAIASSKRNPCPICEKTHGCKISDNLIMCLRGDSNWSIPGWKYLKPLRGGMGGLFGDYSGERQEYRPEQQPKAAKPSNITPLTDEQLDREARKILKQLGLSAKHREQLHGRGLTDEQIDQRGFKSVDRYQEFNLISISPNFPGMGDKGTLANSGSGILIPIRNLNGLIIGFQIARDDRNPKYQWLWGSSDRRVSGELPLQFLKLNSSPDLNIIEGTQKPLPAAHLHNINVLGAGGVNWHGSKKEFKAIVDSKNFDLYILNPDTGCKANHHVMGGYRALYLFLKKLGITLYIRDWGQGDRPKSDKFDIDEITTETFNNARIISYIEWDNDVLDQGELSEEQWFNRFKLPELQNDLARIVKRFYSRVNQKNKSVTPEQNPEAKPVIIPEQKIECSAIVLWKPQKLISISYVPGQLPTFDEWQQMGCPKIIFNNGERLALYGEAAERGFKITLDTTAAGHGKSFDSGLATLETFGIDPDDKENKARIFYLSPDHRNPTNATVEANYTDLEARHNGLNYDTDRKTALGKSHVIRAKNQNPDIPSNCPENQTFLTVAEMGLSAFGGKDSPICQSCPLLNQGCLFLENRRYTLTNERLIRADINSIHPSSDDILILDDLSIENTHQITVEINDVLMMVGKLQLRADHRLFKILRPILVEIYKGLLAVTTEKHRYGISHREVVELMPTIDELNQLIFDLYSDDWLACDNVWGTPIYHYEMINGIPEATKVIGENFIAPSLIDLRNECYKLLENYAKFINGLQTPEEKQQAIKDNVIPPWLPALIDCLIGNKRINLRIDNGKLIITKLSKRHRNIIKSAGLSIALDATQNKRDYALSLGISLNEILEVSEVKQSTPNLHIHIIKGMGRGGKQRRDTMQERINVAINAIAKRHQGQNIGLIDHKSAVANYQDLGHKLGYWHKDTRGSNQFLNTQVMVSVGHPCPNLGQVAAEYQTLTGYFPTPDQRTGRYGGWVNRKIKAELIQDVGRLRAHLRPDEQLHSYLVADLDDDTISALRLAYPTATVIIEDIYDIAPGAASKGVQTERGIIEALWSSVKSGVVATIDDIAEQLGITKGGVSKNLKDRLGIGFREVKKSLLLLYRAINNKSKLSELDSDALYIALEYLPNVVRDFENGQITPADVVVEVVNTAKAYGRQFSQILSVTPIPILCKLWGAVLTFLPLKIRQELIGLPDKLIF
ncbi:hypothetical protein L2E76_22615 [Planktothrix agardhii 1811]|uniref:hypothetical protein n=2 Tax=Planktothrix agardhii TaxID=1160 RepID=UPI001F2A5FB9|nr:hypothetical protein [Planktothrix agardhii]MCF3583297.1 hypothetical protein [Planktothrix agardhii 1811]